MMTLPISAVLPPGCCLERAEVTFASLDVPSREALLATLGDYPEYLKLEYPKLSFKFGLPALATG